MPEPMSNPISDPGLTGTEREILSLKGFELGANGVASVLRMDEAAAESAMRALADRGLLSRHRLNYRITDAGRAALSAPQEEGEGVNDDWKRGFAEGLRQIHDSGSDEVPSAALWAALNDPEAAAESLSTEEQEAYRAAQESVLVARGLLPAPAQQSEGEGKSSGVGDEAQTHELKCWPPYFEAVATGRKTFEIRSIEDRIFHSGDTILLREYDGSLHHREPETGGYTGRTCTRRISYVLGDGDWHVEKGFVVLGLTQQSVPEHSGVEKAVEEAVGRLGPLEHPRAGEWPAIEREHAVALVSQALRDPAIQPFLVQPSEITLASGEPVKVGSEEAQQLVTERDTFAVLAGWDFEGDGEHRIPWDFDRVRKACLDLQHEEAAASPQPENSGDEVERSGIAQIADCLEEALGGPQFKHDVRVVYVRMLAEKVVEFDAWLSFRPEFAEVLTAFRSAFGTDTSATASTQPVSPQQQLSDEDRERLEDIASQFEQVGARDVDPEEADNAAFLRKLASQHHGEEEGGEAKRFTKTELWELRAFALQAGADEMPETSSARQAVEKLNRILDSSQPQQQPEEDAFTTLRPPCNCGCGDEELRPNLMSELQQHGEVEEDADTVRMWRYRQEDGSWGSWDHSSVGPRVVAEEDIEFCTFKAVRS